MAQYAVRKAAAECRQVPGVGLMMHALGAIRLIHLYRLVPVREHTCQCRQIDDKQEGGPYAFATFH